MGYGQRNDDVLCMACVHSLLLLIVLLALVVVIDELADTTYGQIYGTFTSSEVGTNYTTIYLENQPPWTFVNQVSYAKILDAGEVYGFYYCNMKLFRITDSQRNQLWNDGL